MLLACALIPIGVATGCGGGSSNTQENSTPIKAVPLTLGQTLHKAIAACQKGIAASPYLTASEKATGNADCTALKTGNAAAVAGLRAVLKQACERTVAAKIPRADQPAALATCRKVY